MGANGGHSTTGTSSPSNGRMRLPEKSRRVLVLPDRSHLSDRDGEPPLPDPPPSHRLWVPLQAQASNAKIGVASAGRGAWSASVSSSRHRDHSSGTSSAGRWRLRITDCAACNARGRSWQRFPGRAHGLVTENLVRFRLGRGQGPAGATPAPYDLTPLLKMLLVSGPCGMACPSAEWMNGPTTSRQ